MGHTGLRQGVIERHLPLLPPQSSWEEKKTFFFVSEESTAAILTRLRIGISGGALILKTDRSSPDRTQTAFFVQKIEVLVLLMRINANMWGLNGFLSSRKPTVYLISLLESAASRRISVPRRCIYRETATRKIIHLIENIFWILFFLFKPKIDFMAVCFDCEKNDSVQTWNRRSAEKGIFLRFV